jgi:hypothetical protein
VQGYHVVLFVHLVSLLLAAGAAATLHVADVEIRRAQSLSEALRLALRMKRTATAFPFAIVGLVGSGIYMTHHLAWGFSTPWVLAGEVGLAAIVVLGDAVNGRFGRQLGAAIGGALARGGDGALTEEVRAHLENPVAKLASVAPTALRFGVIYVMTVKPGATGSTVAMLVALAAGAVASQALLRTPAAARELATAEATS